MKQILLINIMLFLLSILRELLGAEESYIKFHSYIFDELLKEAIERVKENSP